MENDFSGIAPITNGQHMIKVIGVSNAVAYYFARSPWPMIALVLALVGLFLPEVLSAFGIVSTQIGSHIFATLDNRQLLTMIGSADARLIEFSEKCTNLSGLFETWLEPPTEEQGKNAKISLRINYSVFVVDMLPAIKGAFLHKDYGGFMLPHFAAATSQYLAVLKLYYTYAKELELPATSADASNVQDLVLRKWRKDLADIINTGMDSYRLGLQNIIHGVAGYRRSWDDYNAFRNAVTETGMDMLASFQYSDPLLYPRRCSTRNLNRKLLTFLDASADRHRALKFRSSILFLENMYNPRTAVSTLQRIEMFYAHQQGDFLLGPQYKNIDSLIGVQCTIAAHDGSSAVSQMAYSGWSPKPSTTKVWKLIFTSPCYWVNGRHRYQQNVPATKQLAIVEMSFYLKYNDQHNFDFTAEWVFPKQVTKFSSTIPELTNWEPDDEGADTYHQHRLAHMLVDVTKSDEVHNYVFSWHHLSVLQDLSPETSYIGVAPAATMVEQFHAIRAESSIRTQHLKIIANPGFTGGDLVELDRGQSLSFYLKRTSDRWFAGRYEVRLWCVKPSSSVYIEVSAIPKGPFVKSQVAMHIPEFSGIVPDVNALKFESLASFLMPDVLFITAGMSEVELQLRNADQFAPVIVDRIELTFIAFASDAQSGVPDAM